MSKVLDKQIKRLRARRSVAVSSKATNLPGSQNSHKSFPSGAGHRTKSKVKADSRSATS